MKLNLHQTKALSLIVKYYLGRIRALQTLTKRKPRASCAHSTCWGHARAPHTHAMQETQVV